MENCLQRKAIRVKTDLKGVTSDEAYEEYRTQTRDEYEDLMLEFEFRCRRAAMMNYYEASGYDKKVFRMEVFAAFVGTLSVSSVGMCILKRDQDMSLASLGYMGALGLCFALLIEFLGKGSTRVIPSFSRRSESHVSAGAAWQRLAQKTRSYRIQLDNPRLDVTKYAEWYDELCHERERLCTMVVIPQSTYRLYNDPSKVFRSLRKRRLMFLKFLDLQEMDEVNDFKEVQHEKDDF